MGKGSEIVANARKYLGRPYVWGGESMKEGGYDCSGLVYNVLNDSGIKVGRTTAQGYYNLYKKNKANTLTEGALLFFGKSRVTHVGIAIGDGIHMIESIGSSRNTKNNVGKGVTLSLISRRKDLIAACLPFTESLTVNTNYYPRYTGKGTSIVGALNAVGEKNTSYKHRSMIAAVNGILNYKGTAAQNIKMVELLKQGKLIKG